MSSTAYAGHWGEPEYTYTGSASAVWPHGRNDQYWATGSRTPGGPFGLAIHNGSPFSANTSGEIKAVIRWIPDDPQDNPPSHVVLRESATVQWQGTTSSVDSTVMEGQADNGLGHQQIVSTNGNSKTGISSGKRIIRVAVNNGVVERTCTLSGSFNATMNMVSNPGYPIYYHGYGGIDTVSYSITVVNRWVTITSSRDTTYRREVQNEMPTRVANSPDEFFTIRADVVGNSASVPSFGGEPDSQLIFFYGNHFGSWGYGSWFNWEWSQGYRNAFAYSNNNFWNNYWFLGIPSLDMFFAAPNAGMPGQTAHIHLKAVDSTDNEEAEADYFLKFHDPYEDFVTLNYQASPANPPSQNYDDMPLGGPQGWIWFASVPGPGTVTRTVTYTFELGGEASFEGGSGGEAFSKMLSLKTNIKITAKQVKTVTTTVTLGPIPSDEIWEFYYAPKKIIADGTASEWGDSGYIRDGQWSAYQTEEGIRTWYLKRSVNP